MPKIIVDIHNHLDLLPGPINLYNQYIYRHQNHPSFLLQTARKQNVKLIVSVALYLSPFPGNPIKQIKAQVQRVEQLAQKNSDVKLIKKASDLQGDYKLGLTLHLESARWLNGNIDQLKRLHQMGVRGIIPVHFLTNWFGGSGEDPRSSYGLTETGKRFLDEMSKLHMWMDVSHMDEDTTAQALNYFQGSTIASHIGLQKFKPPKRNISEKNARELFKRGGKYGLIAWSHLMGKTEADFKQQIDFLIAEGFSEHLVIGTDFGAPIKTPKFIKSLFDYSSFIEKNYPQVAEKILSQNALDFLQKALPAD